MKKAPAEIKETINAKYLFTDREKMEFGERIAQKLGEQTIVGEEFSAIKKQWAGKLETIANDISNLAQKISCGFDYRPTECKVTFDAGKRRKYYFRVSDGSPTHDEEMTAADHQLSIPLDEPTAGGIVNPTGPLVSVGEVLESAETEAIVAASDIPAEPPPEEPAKKKGVKSRKSKAAEPYSAPEESDAGASVFE